MKMMMRVLNDIRAFWSDVPNIDGQPHPVPLEDHALWLYLRRIALKLREMSFILGEFERLYLNFTPCLPEGEIRIASRTPKKGISGFHYVDVGVSSSTQPLSIEYVRPVVERAILLFLPDDVTSMLHAALDEADKGEEMLARYKEKRDMKYIARLYLRLLDSGMYLPILHVYSRNTNSLCHQWNLPLYPNLQKLGNMIITCRSVTIRPVQIAITDDIRPMIFRFDGSEPIIPSSP